MSLLTSLLRKPACGYFKIPSSVRCFIQVSFVLFFLAVKCCLSELLYSFFKLNTSLSSGSGFSSNFKI